MLSVYAPLHTDNKGNIPSCCMEKCMFVVGWKALSLPAQQGAVQLTLAVASPLSDSSLLICFSALLHCRVLVQVGESDTQHCLEGQTYCNPAVVIHQVHFAPHDPFQCL